MPPVKKRKKKKRWSKQDHDYTVIWPGFFISAGPWDSEFRAGGIFPLAQVHNFQNYGGGILFIVKMQIYPGNYLLVCSLPHAWWVHLAKSTPNSQRAMQPGKGPTLPNWLALRGSFTRAQNSGICFSPATLFRINGTSKHTCDLIFGAFPLRQVHEKVYKYHNITLPDYTD